MTAFLNDRIKFISLQHRLNSEEDLKQVGTHEEGISATRGIHEEGNASARA
jgi:hypothetical protein